MFSIKEIFNRLLGRTATTKPGQVTVLHQSFSREFPFLQKQANNQVLEPAMFKNEYYEGDYVGRGWQTAGYLPCFSLKELPNFHILLIVYPESKDTGLALLHKRGPKTHAEWVKLEKFIQKFPELEITKSLIFNQGSFKETGIIPGIGYNISCLNL